MNVNRGHGLATAPFRTAWRATVLVALAGALTAGCGSACDEAADHQAECGFDDEDDYSGASCNGKVECDSKCLTDTPCGAFDGTDTTARDTYLECVRACPPDE